jgi:hypothetical protein
MSRIPSLTLAGLLALIAVPARGQDPSVDPNTPPPGQEILTRGPIHEAFAEPVVFDPKAGPVVPKAPPAAIEEVPPDQKPEGGNVQWIPGYWAWDDSRGDYIWISGLWRDIPPGRQWVPGYWHQVDGGYQWVSGAWMSEQADPSQQPQYLPEPPQSIEAGPNSNPPVAGAVWAPGNWVWQGDRYAWQPGYWVNPQPNWMWVPSHYNYTPNGYLYNSGYWDRPIAQRGQLFAPVYYSQPLYSQSGYTYRPTVGLLATSLLSSLFVRPSYGQYYFGDYYAPNNFSSGIYPSYSYHQSRYGYDPLYSYYAATNLRSNPNWATQQREAYLYRRDHADARPPQTYAAQQRINASVTNISNVSAVTNNINNMAMARPLAQIASGGGQAARFERVNAAQQTQIANQTRQLQQFRQERVQREVVAARNLPAADRARPRPADLPKSPIVAAHSPTPTPAAPIHVPPAAPNRPKVEPNIKPTPANQPAPRPAPHPEVQHNQFGLPQANPARPQPRPEQPKPAARPAMQPQPAPAARPVPQPTPTPKPDPKPDPKPVPQPAPAARPVPQPAPVPRPAAERKPK